MWTKFYQFPVTTYIFFVFLSAREFFIDECDHIKFDSSKMLLDWRGGYGMCFCSFSKSWLPSINWIIVFHYFWLLEQVKIFFSSLNKILAVYMLCLETPSCLWKRNHKNYAFHLLFTYLEYVKLATSTFAWDYQIDLFLNLL